MKTYQQLKDHLEEAGCKEDPDTIIEATEEAPRSSLWRNCINGEHCQIFDEDHGFLACCHVLYELKVVPFEDMQEDYIVYSSEREHIEMQQSNMESDS